MKKEHYQLAITAAIRMKDVEQIKSLLGEMLIDPTFNLETTSMLPQACKAIADGGDWRLAKKLMGKVPLPRPNYLYHAIIASCGRASNPTTALELFEQMIAEDHSPSRATYNAVLHAVQEKGDLVTAKAILERMTNSGLSLNVVTYNIALNARAKVGDVRGSVNLLSEMEKAGIEPSVVSFSTAIHAASRANSSTAALTLLNAMEPAGVVPNECVPHSLPPSLSLPPGPLPRS